MKPTDKWCPMARVDVGGEGVAAVNRRPLPPGGAKMERDEWLNAKCIGQRCAVFVGADTTGRCGLIRG